MAGDWIKVETCTPGKAEIIRLARLLSMKHDEALGVVVRFWMWADTNTVDGRVDGVASTDVDAVLSCPGICRALEAVGWLVIDKEKESIKIPKFDRHNGESAKKRALTNRRQAKWRNASVDGASSTSASTREEKRRVIKQETPPAKDAGPLWGESLAILTEQGFSEKSARAFIGGLCREYGEADIVEAVRASMGKANCPAYIRGVLKARRKRGVPGELKVAMP